jgi:hypothetical protein
VSRLLGAVPGVLFPDPGPAHDWLRHELSRPEYQESLLQRFTRWFDGVLDAVGNAGTGGFSPVVGLVLLALLAGGIAFALSRLRPNPGSATPDATVFADARETSEEHRRRAQAALAQARWGETVVESVRAMASGLVERGLVPEQSGITVHELSERAGRLFPDHGRRLEAASRVFDETRYGDRPATEQQARDAVELERELARSAPSGTRDGSATTAVPR